MPRKGEEEGWPGKGAKRKKGRAKTGQIHPVGRTGSPSRQLGPAVADFDVAPFGWPLRRHADHCMHCELFFPIRGPGKPPRKEGEKLLNSPPRSDPKVGKSAPTKRKNDSENTIFAFFPIFGGRTGEGNLVIFPHFPGFPSGRLPRGASKGKNN